MDICKDNRLNNNNRINPGTVYWITGLSGAGKTTMGQKLFRDMRKLKKDVLLLDGDELREIINNKDYSYDGRKQVAMQYSRMCRMLSCQGMDVIICTVSMYDEVREWNRKNIANYCEIYIKVPLEELIRRDQKGLYSQVINKTSSNVIGMDIDFEEPKQPDIVMQNDGKSSVEDVYMQLIKELANRRETQ